MNKNRSYKKTNSLGIKLLFAVFLISMTAIFSTSGNASEHNNLSAALAFYSIEISDNPHTMGPGEFKDFLNANFQKVSSRSIKIGDLIVFMGKFTRTEADFRNGIPIKETFSYENPYHAAVVIDFSEDGYPLLLQKIDGLNLQSGQFTYQETINFLESKSISGLSQSWTEVYRKNK